MSKTDEVRELLHPFPDVWTEAKITEANKILAIVQQLEQDLAEARRVLAKHEACDFSHDGYDCISCGCGSRFNPHKPDCEWLAGMGKVTP